ncbi:MAG: multiprotein-bridging factor 1 family protein [Nitrososphaerota archaeon]
MLANKEKKQKKKKEHLLIGEDLELIENYGEIIRNARIKMGLSQEELAKQISEKLTIIKKIEQGAFKPPIELARKLEKFLKIKIIEKVETFHPSTLKPYIQSSHPSTMPLGYLIKKIEEEKNSESSNST